MLIFERWLNQRSARRSVRWALAMALGLTLYAGAADLAEAQAAGSNRPTTAAAASNPLRRQLENRYEVLALRDGLLLRPRAERSGVRSIEVSGTSIAVNGERVSDSVLRAWLGEDAGPLLDLLALPAAERRALFELSAPGVGATPEAGSTPPTGTGESAGSTGPTELTDDAVAELPAVPAEPGAPVPPELPETPSRSDDEEEDSDSSANVRIGTLVRFAGSARVDADEEAEQVVVIGGAATVDGSVQQEVTAIGGRVTVNGRVGGDVISVGGSVHLGPKAEVGGDVTSVGGTVEREPGAKVHGQINQAAGFGPRIHIGGDHDFDDWPWWTPFAGAMRLMWSILTLAIFALLVAVTVVVARDPVARVEAKLAGEFWQSGLAGFLAQLLFIPLFVLVTVVLMVSIVGIPLLVLYPFLFLALILGGLIGFSAFALWVGRLVERRFDRHFGSVVATALVGLFAIEICRIIGRLLAIGHGPLDVFGWFFSITGFLLSYVAWTVGFGAVILTRFGMGPRRPRGGVPEVPPPYETYAAVPLDPIPPVPPLVPPPVDGAEEGEGKGEDAEPKPAEPGP